MARPRSASPDSLRAARFQQRLRAVAAFGHGHQHLGTPPDFRIRVGPEPGCSRPAQGCRLDGSRVDGVEQGKHTEARREESGHDQVPHRAGKFLPVVEQTSSRRVRAQRKERAGCRELHGFGLSRREESGKGRSRAPARVETEDANRARPHVGGCGFQQRLTFRGLEQVLERRRHGEGDSAADFERGFTDARTNPCEAVTATGSASVATALLAW